jgi:hypothetical protein
MKNMGKSLSPLQRDILAVLEEWPTFELAESAAAGSVKDWALPRDIIRRLGRPKTRSTQATISRALLQLHKKGLVARASGELADVGKAFHYLRITNPVNAGAGNNGPTVTLGRARHVEFSKARRFTPAGFPRPATFGHILNPRAVPRLKA